MNFFCRINLSSGSNLSCIDESLEIVDVKRSSKSDRNKSAVHSPGKSKSFLSPFTNRKISDISTPPLNDSADLNISCDVSVLNVTRSKNGRRKSVLGINVVYLLSSDSDYPDSDKENEKEKNHQKEATLGILYAQRGSE